MKRNSQNLQHHLLARESNLYPGRRHPIPSSFLFHEKNFYKSITPRLTVQNVVKPCGYLRKFSPDGKYLIVFSLDQKSLDVYEYQGVGNVNWKLVHQEKECVTASNRSFRSLYMRQEIFENLFKLKYHIPIITVPWAGRHVLNREFSIFLDSGNYVLVGSVASGSIFPSISAYHEYVDLFDNTDLYDIRFYVIDLRTGNITDTIIMEHDCVALAHNHSVSFCEPTVAILSTYRQCIEIFLFDSVLGKLQRSHTVGPFLSELDRDRVLLHLRDTNFEIDPSCSLPLSSLKQKILAHIYREILEIKSPDERRLRVKEFYKNFPLYERMLVFKMQLFDENNVLLRFEPRRNDMPVERLSNADDSFKMYVFYNITLQKVLRVFDNESVELLRIVRNYSHNFRNSYSLFVPWHSSATSDNNIVRGAFESAVSSFRGGLVEAAVKFNPSIPISSQCYTTSPYLDYSLFDYDDRHISTLERPKLNSAYPIEFSDRDTGLLKFRLFLEQSYDARLDNVEPCRVPRALVTYIFHPYEPFIISIQKFFARYVVNFHLYSSMVKHRKR